MKISVSLLANRQRPLAQVIQELEALRIDLFHIDCRDEVEVFDFIAEVRSLSKTPIDLHLITNEPAKYVDLIKKHKVEYVTYQLEELDLENTLSEISNTKTGIAITSETELERFEPYQSIADFMLFMTTIPGESGGQFRKENFRKIREFSRRFPGKQIHVDGGVNPEVCFILRQLGVDTAVSGSFIMNNENAPAAILDLKTGRTHSHFLLRDFMHELDELPVLNAETANFHSIVKTIEQFNAGFALLTNTDGTLHGISSNADLRRGILSNIGELDKIDAASIINRSPICVYDDMSINEMLDAVQKLGFIILFLPVLNRSNKLVGAVTFNSLILGET